jgi:transcriptional regulator with XRE-family HTH domain
MSVMQMVPAELVGIVREAVRDELRDTADALTDAISPVSQKPRGSYREHRSYFNAVCRLLDVIGCVARDPLADVQVNLREHRVVLLAAMRGAQQAAEGALGDVREGREKDPAKREVIIARAEALRELLADTEERVRRLQHDDRSVLVRSAGELGRVLRARLRELGLSHEQVADLSGVDEVALGELERGESALVQAEVLRVVHTLGLDVEIRPRALGAASRGDQMVIPAGQVGGVRGGLHTVLGGAVQGVSEAVNRPGRERHPEWYEEDRERFECACALLDLIGWGEPREPVEVVVDLRIHHGALGEALDASLEVAEDDLREAEDVDAGRAKQGLAPMQEETTRRVLALRDFACEAKGKIEATLLSQGALT